MQYEVNPDVEHDSMMDDVAEAIQASETFDEFWHKVNHLISEEKSQVFWSDHIENQHYKWAGC